MPITPQARFLKKFSIFFFKILQKVNFQKWLSITPLTPKFYAYNTLYSEKVIKRPQTKKCHGVITAPVIFNPAIQLLINPGDTILSFFDKITLPSLNHSKIFQNGSVFLPEKNTDFRFTKFFAKKPVKTGFCLNTHILQH